MKNCSLTLILLAAMCGVFSGCVSSMIADIGRRPGRYEDRAEVRESLGEPTAVGTVGDETWERYEFQGKVRSLGEAQGVGMAAGLSLGVSEVLFVPLLLGRLPFELMETHQIVYEFDQEGKVIDYDLDNEKANEVQEETTSVLPGAEAGLPF